MQEAWQRQGELMSQQEYVSFESTNISYLQNNLPIDDFFARLKDGHKWLSTESLGSLKSSLRSGTIIPCFSAHNTGTPPIEVFIKNLKIFTQRKLIELEGELPPELKIYDISNTNCRICSKSVNLNIDRLKDGTVRAYDDSKNKLFDIEDRPYSLDELKKLIQEAQDRNQEKKFKRQIEKTPLPCSANFLTIIPIIDCQIINDLPTGVKPLGKVIKVRFRFTDIYINIEDKITVRFNSLRHAHRYELLCNNSPAMLVDPNTDIVKILVDMLKQAGSFNNLFRSARGSHHGG
jgi:hypothetical protein